ncbi:proteophosphoglycan ppg4 [Rhodotorula toruloides]|uniref:Proteophosphoglycan ppg4 n=1 Tax=Rhodotorula toruloides TaxID=5286 RepID=A0A511KJU8_RHOTO|nr:proteophosphoglycan ppg4 [Rhodotorula toruloides]
MSTLAADAMNWDEDGNADIIARDEEMMSMSPGYEATLAPPALSSVPRRTRSRSGSGSAPMLLHNAGSSSLPPSVFPFPSVPPSPLTVARALQAGQKTPPPFLQRRLFKDDTGSGSSVNQDEGTSASGRSSRSGSSSDVAMSGTRPRPIRAQTLASAFAADEDEEIEELSAVLSRSASAGPEEPFDRVVRRPVSRKPNLLPKPKSHLRILSELKTEASGDMAEIASEATLHRLSRAGASAVPALRSSCPPLLDAKAASNPPPPTQSGPRPTSTAPRPTPNRFPEQVEDDDPISAHNASSNSSNDEADEAAEVGSDWGGMSVGGYATEEDEERRSNVVWNGIRSGPGGSAVTVATPTGTGRSPGSGGRAGMELESPFATPGTPTTSLAARPGKRKMHEDRFEPYAHQAFKRRAVSPAASLTLSPGFIQQASMSGNGSFPSGTTSRPTPPPLMPSTLSTMSNPSTQPVTIPSPTGSAPHYSFFSSVSGAPPGTRSAAASPSGATASSLSSSTGGGLGRGFMSFALSDRHKPISVIEERERRNQSMKVEPGAMGRMSLGEEEEEL